LIKTPSIFQLVMAFLVAQCNLMALQKSGRMKLLVLTISKHYNWQLTLNQF